MKKIISLIAIISVAAFSASVMAADPHPPKPPTGSYSQSCTDIRMEADTLHATCKKINQSSMASHLKIPVNHAGDLANCDGVLKFGACAHKATNRHEDCLAQMKKAHTPEKSQHGYMMNCER